MGPVIVIVNQGTYTYTGTGHSIFCVGQMEHYRPEVFGKSKEVGGKQIVTTCDGYTIPIRFSDGLPYIQICPYKDKEWDEVPHVFLTGNTNLDPEVLDRELDDSEWMDAVQEDTTDNKFDNTGNYLHCEADMAFMDPYISVNRLEAVHVDDMTYLPGSDIRETTQQAEKIQEAQRVSSDESGPVDWMP